MPDETPRHPTPGGRAAVQTARTRPRNPGVVVVLVVERICGMTGNLGPCAARFNRFGAGAFQPSSSLRLPSAVDTRCVATTPAPRSRMLERKRYSLVARSGVSSTAM